MNDSDREPRSMRLSALRRRILVGVAVLASLVIIAGALNWVRVGLRDNRPPDPCHSVALYEYAEDYNLDVRARTANSDSIIIGKIEAKRQEKMDPAPFTVFDVEVEATLRGRLPSGRASLIQAGVEGCESNTSPMMEVGSSYLIYMRSDGGSEFTNLESVWNDPLPFNGVDVERARRDPKSVGRLSDLVFEIGRTPFVPPQK